jgi:hypothetical protein
MKGEMDDRAWKTFSEHLFLRLCSADGFWTEEFEMMNLQQAMEGKWTPWAVDDLVRRNDEVLVF